MLQLQRRRVNLHSHDLDPTLTKSSHIARDCPNTSHPQDAQDVQDAQEADRSETGPDSEIFKHLCRKCLRPKHEDDCIDRKIGENGLTGLFAREIKRADDATQAAIFTLIKRSRTISEVLYHMRTWLLGADESLDYHAMLTLFYLMLEDVDCPWILIAADPKLPVKPEILTLRGRSVKYVMWPMRKVYGPGDIKTQDPYVFSPDTRRFEFPPNMEQNEYRVERPWNVGFVVGNCLDICSCCQMVDGLDDERSSKPR